MEITCVNSTVMFIGESVAMMRDFSLITRSSPRLRRVDVVERGVKVGIKVLQRRGLAASLNCWVLFGL
jgi:hypothetical protein